MIRFVFAALTILLAGPAWADDLPGVGEQKQIVQPLPEPIDEKPAADQDGIKVGDWDVKVSGSIIIDVGVGNIKPPRR